MKSYSIRSTLDCPSLLGMDSYLLITTGWLPGILRTPGYDMPRGVPGLRTGEGEFLESASQKWLSCNTRALLLSPSLPVRGGMVRVRFLSPPGTITASFGRDSWLPQAASVEPLDWSKSLSSVATFLFSRNLPYCGKFGSNPVENDLLSSVTLSDDVFVRRPCFKTFWTSPNTCPRVFERSFFRSDSKLSERLSAFFDELFVGLVNWKGLAEWIERTGAVRGDGMTRLTMGDERLETWTNWKKDKMDD